MQARQREARAGRRRSRLRALCSRIARALLALCSRFARALLARRRSSRAANGFRSQWVYLLEDVDQHGMLTPDAAQNVETANTTLYETTDWRTRQLPYSGMVNVLWVGRQSLMRLHARA